MDNPGSYIVGTLRRKGLDIRFRDVISTIKFDGGHAYDGGRIEVSYVPTGKTFVSNFSWWKEIPQSYAKILNEFKDYLDSIWYQSGW
jgi:hypothetical protein